MGGEERDAAGGRHVFVALEAGSSSKGLDWDAIRQNVAATGGYLSLALIDGAKSNWIVRPVPTAAQIPAQVSTASAGTAAPGIAAMLVDQVMEAQGLVPAIRTTEVRLYGGDLAEGELYDALRGEATIRLRVFDKNRLRDGRAVAKRPAPRPQAGTTGSPAGAGRTPNRTGASSAPKRPATKPNPGPPSGTSPRVTPTVSVPKVRVSTTTGATGAVRSPVGAPTSSPPAVPRESFGKRYKPVRRIFGGLLAAAVVGMGVFPGFVGANIWGYSYPGEAALITEVISSAQSRAFGVALLIGALVATVGTRARWLPFAGFAYGIVAGVLPAAIPGFLVWQAPPPLVTVLTNTAGFWGMWTAYAALLYIGAGIALCVAVSRILPATPDAVIKTRARNRAAVREWIGRRSPVDKVVIALVLWLGLTALVPWLIGRFILQDNILFETGSGVFDPSAREFWPYAIPLYLGGLAIVLVLAGLAMVFQPWKGRNGLGLTGIVVVGAAVAAGMFGATLWVSVEEATATRLTSTAFPFADQFLTCGHAEAPLMDAAGETWLYQVWTARIKNSDVGSSDCNRINVYKGWQRIASVDLPEGQVVIDGPVFVSGTTTADAVFQYVQTDGQTIPMTVGDQ